MSQNLIKNLSENLTIDFVNHEGLDHPTPAADGLVTFELVVYSNGGSTARHFRSAEYTQNYEIVRSEQNNSAYPDVFRAVANEFGTSEDSEEFIARITQLWNNLDDMLADLYPAEEDAA